MKCRSDASSKVLFGCFNSIFFTCGFLEVVCGFLLLCDSKRILLSLLLATPESALAHPPFYYLALALLAAGLVMCATAALGYWATYIPGYVILTIYFLVVLSLLLCECAGGVLAAVWPRCLGLQGAPGGAVAALQNYYAVPDHEQFTAAMDLAQTELQCCGMSGASDYDMSTWQLRRLGPRGARVPPACCVQRAAAAPAPAPAPAPATAASHRDRDPAPLNATRCQLLQPSAFRHESGCLEKLEDWYQQHYLILMLGLFIFALFKLGILLSTVYSCIRIKKRRHIVHSVTIKSVDNRTSENIYESNVHDEPITAKYVQPNNFYSPRVRNPRIFTHKPNEMV